MLKYKLSKASDEVIITLRTDDPDKSVKIEYVGDKDLVEVVSDWLRHESGLYGHLIGDRTTPIDLDAVMRSPDAEQYSPEIIEGAEIIENYDPPELDENEFY